MTSPEKKPVAANWQRRIDQLLNPGPRAPWQHKLIPRIITGLIFISIFSMVVETSHISPQYRYLLHLFDQGILLLFSLEYLLRLLTVSGATWQGWRGRIRYALTPLMLLDLLVVLPLWIHGAMINLPALRLIRLFLLLKLGRLSRKVRMLGEAIVSIRAELGFASLMALIVLFICSTLIYHVENPVQPQVFSSIPAAMWWAVTTLTTVGYGDMYPVTPPGRMIAAFTQVFGVILFAMPAGVLASSLISVTQVKHCPHCGQSLRAQRIVRPDGQPPAAPASGASPAPASSMGSHAAESSTASPASESPTPETPSPKTPSPKTPSPKA